jgi:hypothetical protein
MHLAVRFSPNHVFVSGTNRYAVDSLKAIEVRNWIFGELKADVSVFEILSPVPLSQLAMKIVSKSTLVSAGLATEAAAESTA